MLRKILFVVFALFTIWIIIQCDTNEPPTNSTISLKLEEVFCTEAWITLTTTNLQLPTTVILKQNDQTRSTINLVTPDTLLYTDSLLPNQTYIFQSFIQSITQSSNELRVTTMDTTSHNFTWQTWTFGEHDASFLWDVVIIDENNISAVGEIYMNDSLGQPDLLAYNAVDWDGIGWELKRVYFPTVCGSNILTPYPAKAIFSFENGQIWVSSSGDKIGILQHGSQINQFCLPSNVSMSINKIWGSNSNDLYIVGDGGSIAYYNGSSWNKIVSGTETRINDVWGIISNESKTILYCPVSSFFVQGDKKILKIADGTVDSVLWNRDVRLYSAWAVNENILYVCGEGAYVNKFGKWQEINLYPAATNSVRGNDLNDIFIVGDNGSIFHFNGVSWKMLSTPNNKGYSKVAVKGNIVVICGNYLGQAIIEVGTRN